MRTICEIQMLKCEAYAKDEKNICEIYANEMRAIGSYSMILRKKKKMSIHKFV